LLWYVDLHAQSGYFDHLDIDCESSHGA
jgi:hypothetical protein